MQTLIDPFELASRALPAPVARPLDVASSLVDIDVQLEEDAASKSANPDSSGRLRCWCSEE